MNTFQMSPQIPLGFAIHLKADDVVRLLSTRCFAYMGLSCPTVWDGGSVPEVVEEVTRGDVSNTCPVRCGSFMVGELPSLEEFGIQVFGVRRTLTLGFVELHPSELGNLHLWVCWWCGRQ